MIQAIEIEGVALSDTAIEAFARHDGFGSELADGFARRRMGEFWCKTYDWNAFHGVVISWEPR